MLLPQGPRPVSNLAPFLQHCSLTGTRYPPFRFSSLLFLRMLHHFWSSSVSYTVNRLEASLFKTVTRATRRPLTRSELESFGILVLRRETIFKSRIHVKVSLCVVPIVVLVLFILWLTHYFTELRVCLENNDNEPVSEVIFLNFTASDKALLGQMVNNSSDHIVHKFGTLSRLEYENKDRIFDASGYQDYILVV